MRAPIKYQPWWRMPPAPPPKPTRRPSSTAFGLAGYWVLAGALAYGIHADFISIKPSRPSPAERTAQLTPPESASQPPFDPPSHARRPAPGIVAPDVRDDAADVEEPSEPAPVEPPSSEPAPHEPPSSDPRPSEPPPPEPEQPEPPPSEEPVAARDEAGPDPDAEPITDGSADDAPQRHARGPGGRGWTIGSALDEIFAPPSQRRVESRRPRADDAPRDDKPRERKPRRAARGPRQSCEAAVAGYREEIRIGAGRGKTPADISRARYGAVLNRGNYFSHCGVPQKMKVRICAAVQHGRAIGVTVGTTPRSRSKQACIANAVRGLSFPSHPRMDVTTTIFK
jgi:hypothetical protein